MNNKRNIITLKNLFKGFNNLNEYVNEYINNNTSYNENIIITGNIKSIKKYKMYNNNYILFFNLSDEEYNLNCNSKFNHINKIILNNENKKVNLKGYLTSSKTKNNLYGLKVEIIFNVIDIYTNINEDEINLYEKVKQLGYIDNKKNINWKNIKNIALISKDKTHGYNDFITVINQNYFNIDLFEITLEGPNTEKDLINTIININEKFENNLNNYDIILILRGGGSTEAISLSFDKLNIFNTIKQSIIPICSAIGHSDDTNEKLIITQITDYDFITPTEAGLFLNQFIPNNKLIFNKLLSNVILNKYQKFINYNHIKQSLNYLLLSKYNNFNKSIKQNLINYFKNLIDIFDDILNSYFLDLSKLKIKIKYHTIDINNNFNLNNIIIHQNNTYYKIIQLDKFNEYNKIYQFNNYLDEFINKKEIINKNDFLKLKNKFKKNSNKEKYFFSLKNKYYSSNFDNIFIFFDLFTKIKNFYSYLLNDNLINFNLPNFKIYFKSFDLLNNNISIDFNLL